MFLVDALLILAMLFFLFLPISDRRTVRMRLCMIGALLAVFSVSVSRTHVAPVLLASLSGSAGSLQSPHILRKPSSGFSSSPASDIRLLHGQGNI
jgi:di/tricarboxylate transporter